MTTATATQGQVTFSRNKRTGRFDVVGPADIIRPGELIEVVKRDGTTKRVRVAMVSKEFVGQFGPNEGLTCVFGTIAWGGRKEGAK